MRKTEGTFAGTESNVNIDIQSNGVLESEAEQVPGEALSLGELNQVVVNPDVPFERKPELVAWHPANDGSHVFSTLENRGLARSLSPSQDLIRTREFAAASATSQDEEAVDDLHDATQVGHGNTVANGVSEPARGERG